jgi:dihydrofolate reductase
MKISIIVAVSENNVIGKKGKLPWHLPADLRHFKQITWGHTLIMGQKTNESMAKPLPGRKTIVLSDNPKYKAKGCYVANSVKEALDLAKHLKESEVFIAGGGSVYKQFLPLADKIYLTRIHHNFDGDVFFPEIDRKKWKQVALKNNDKDKINPHPYDFIIFIKNKFV